MYSTLNSSVNKQDSHQQSVEPGLHGLRRKAVRERISRILRSERLRRMMCEHRTLCPGQPIADNETVGCSPTADPETSCKIARRCSDRIGNVPAARCDLSHSRNESATATINKRDGCTVDSSLSRRGFLSWQNRIRHHPIHDFVANRG